MISIDFTHRRVGLVHDELSTRRYYTFQAQYRGISRKNGRPKIIFSVDVFDDSILRYGFIHEHTAVMHITVQAACARELNTVTRKVRGAHTDCISPSSSSGTPSLRSATLNYEVDFFLFLSSNKRLRKTKNHNL